VVKTKDIFKHCFLWKPTLIKVSDEKKYILSSKKKKKSNAEQWWQSHSNPVKCFSVFDLKWDARFFCIFAELCS
jgi:hypothetical protein